MKTVRLLILISCVFLAACGDTSSEENGGGQPAPVEIEQNSPLATPPAVQNSAPLDSPLATPSSE